MLVDFPTADGVEEPLQVTAEDEWAWGDSADATRRQAEFSADPASTVDVDSLPLSATVCVELVKARGKPTNLRLPYRDAMGRINAELLNAAAAAIRTRSHEVSRPTLVDLGSLLRFAPAIAMPAQPWACCYACAHR